MLLQFKQFDVQDISSCSKDNVTLTDTATGIELFMLCGNQLPDDVLSSSNEMTVVFATDNSVTTNGFFISYVASSEVFGKQTMLCRTHARTALLSHTQIHIF